MDLPRLKAILGQPATAWILERIRNRMERGVGVSGTITLNTPTDEERSALDRLLGRLPSTGGSLTLDLQRLEETLQHGEICGNLVEAMTAICGPIRDLKAIDGVERKAWEDLFTEAHAIVSDRPTLGDWLQELRNTGLLRRLAAADLARAKALLSQAVEAARRLPAQGTPLAQLSAFITGDSHSLDRGSPLGTLVFGAAARIGGIADVGDDAQGHRDVWAAVGVACDELGITVLALNIPTTGNLLTDDVLGLYARQGQPCRIALRDLLRHPPAFSVRGRPVFVCENRTIVAAIADRMGSRCPPLVCTDGQPSSAVRVFLSGLAAAGALLHYHGDFDWGGVRIGNLIMRRHGAIPWRYRREDYIMSAGKGSILTGSPVSADWDATLMGAMVERHRMVHEEQVVEQLINDLG